MRIIAKFIGIILFWAIVVHEPVSSADPSASPSDRAMEDLTRVDFPSQRAVPGGPTFSVPRTQRKTSLARIGRSWRDSIALIGAISILA